MGVDATIRSVERFSEESLLTDIALDVQLKATTKYPSIVDGKISYFLKGIERYDKLRKEKIVPSRILVVLFLPKDQEDWLNWSEDELSLRKCAWWVSLRGAEVSTNTNGLSVYLPQDQFFNPEGLRKIMTRLSIQEVLDYAG